MIKRVKDKVYEGLEIMETIISIMVAIAIMIAILALVRTLGITAFKTNHIQAMNEYIGTAFTVVIGIEFVKMLVKHRPSTVVEVLLFAIARQMVVEHTTPLQNLQCIISIAMLFGIRKYLFGRYDEVEKTTFTPNTAVKSINHACGVYLPYENEKETILELFYRKLDIEKVDVEKGSSVFFDNCALRVSKIYNGNITAIEVIRCVTKDIAHTRL